MLHRRALPLLGRVLTAEYADFFLVNVYVPNSQRELTRLDYRQQWDRDFLGYLKSLERRAHRFFSERQHPLRFCAQANEL